MMQDSSWIVLAVMTVAWLLHLYVLRKQQSRKIQEIDYLHYKQKKMEETLEQRSYHLDDVLSAIHEPVLRIDRDGKVLSTNSEAEALFSVRKFTSLPQPMVALYRNPEWLIPFHQGLEGLPQPTNLPEIFIGGQVFSARLAALNGSQALVFFSNITEAYRLDKQRKNFISNLMHDLKTPLTSLLGYARSMELFVDDKALRSEAVEVICQEARHVSSLLDALLSVEQIEQTSAVGAHCDAANICRQVWKSLQPLMNEKGVSLDLDAPKTEFIVAMHEADCYRVMMNVASNAVNYTATDSEITCSLLGAQLCIEDEGEGIPAKDLNHVTERFYRVDKSRARGGHGLGLAIVKETLLRDGGKIQLKNRNEGGLQVLLQLPE